MPPTTKPPVNPEIAKKRESGRMIRVNLTEALTFLLTQAESEGDGWVSAAKLRATLGANLKDFSKVTYQMSLSATIESRGWGGAREYRLRHRMTPTDRKKTLLR